EEELVGKGYEILFDDFDLDYSSLDNLEYVRLIKAVKDYNTCSIAVSLSDRKPKPSKIKTEINFAPTSFALSDEYRYGIFRFQRLYVVNEAEERERASANKVLLANLQRRLRIEETLREVANLILSDLSIQEIAYNIAKILVDYLKVDRCVIHDFSEGKIDFIIEYNGYHSAPILTEGRINEKVKQYLNFEQGFHEKYGSRIKKSAVMVVNDVASDSHFSVIEPLWREFLIRSELSVNTVVGGRVNGGIYIHQASGRVWNEDEVGLLENIADHFAMALDRSDSIERVMITNHALMEKTVQLREALKHEQEMRKMQNGFVALVSHEFKTPLQIIDSARELIERKLRHNNALDASLASSFERVHSGVQRMNGLIVGVLNLAKLENNENPIKLEPCLFDLQKLIADIIEKNMPLASSKNIKVISRLDDLSEPFYGDPKLLEHAINNLISNAVKYSRNDSTVKIFAKANQSRIGIRVVDEGIGISKEDLPNIGRKFFRARNASAVAGTGIGIYLANHFVTMHGGELKIESEVGVGTSITVIMPRKHD
ncbi:MAG: GAF domain-containing sensor histidine kinase, partial [Alphaproteobacteria bacterium]|nr:GAF domain-containing sensor histidine kinase [Alphaproteobacteria bacterium]